MELQGTSMAAPHVAGLAALLKQRNPSWGHAQLKARVIDSVDRLIAWNGVVFAGGRINAQKALGQAPPPGNRSPVAVDDAYETVQNAPLLRNPPGVLANDTDPDGDTLTAKLKRAPTSGAVDMTAQGAFLYRPNQDFRGLDTFTYEASDGKLASEAKVSIVVTPKQANRPPVAQPDTVIGEEPGPLTGNVLANDTDPDGDPMFASLHAGVARGKLDFDERDGSFTYRPNPGFTGQDGFAYRAVDPHGGVSAVTPVTLKVNKRAQPPSDDELRRKALETMQALIDLLKKLNP